MRKRKILIWSWLTGSVAVWLLAGLWHEIVMVNFYEPETGAAHEGTVIIFLAYLLLGLIACTSAVTTAVHPFMTESCLERLLEYCGSSRMNWLWPVLMVILFYMYSKMQPGILLSREPEE